MIIGKIQSIAGYFILLWGRKRSAAAVFTGALSGLALAPINAFPVLFVTFPILIWLLDGAAAEPTNRLSGKFWAFFKTGWLFGFGYFLAGFWWVGNALLVDVETFAWLLPIAVIALPAVLAIFWGIAIAIGRMFWCESWHRILVLALFLSLAEYARGTLFTGLPWNTIGYAAMPVPLMMQSASVIGVYGVTLMSLPVFACLAVFSTRTSGQAYNRAIMLTLAVSLTIAHLGYGFWRLSSASDEMVEGVSLRLVQPAIDQREKWDPEKESEIFRRYLSLSTGPTSNEDHPAKQGLGGTTHLIWPESALPFILTERRDAMAAIAAMLPPGTSLITGAMRTEAPISMNEEGFVFNSVYAIDSEGLISAAADKTHLVPFGEYLPFQDMLESLGFSQLTKVRGGFEPGNGRKLISVGPGPAFLPLICYEIIFTGKIRGKDQFPGWIVNLTNDAWFGNTPGPYQHLQQSIVRGVEEGLPIVRVANSGISAVSDGYGRVLHTLPLGEQGVIDALLPQKTSATVFSGYGNFIFFALMGVFLVIIVVRKK